MMNNGWFKLAALSFIGIIVSFGVLGLISSNNMQGMNMNGTYMNEQSMQHNGMSNMNMQGGMNNMSNMQNSGSSGGGMSMGMM